MTLDRNAEKQEVPVNPETGKPYIKVIRDATMKLAGQGYRTDVVIRLDIRPGFEGQIHAKQELVNEILSK